MRFALANRALLAHRFAGELGAEVRLVSDVAHNMVTRERFEGEPAWIHRKGAASALEAQAAGALMIPGSRGTPSYLVRVAGDTERAAWSVAHGAGRRWQRGYAKSRLSHKYRVEDLVRTELGGRVICEDRELLYDEAPQAYKDIAQVIADLENLGLVRTIAVYRPVLTYKVRRAEREGRAEMSNAQRIWLQITSGRGPAECQLAVAKLAAVVEKEARAAGLACELLDAVEGSERGALLSALLSIEGEARVLVRSALRRQRLVGVPVAVAAHAQAQELVRRRRCAEPA